MGTRDFASLRADIRRDLASLGHLEAETQQLLARVPGEPSFVEIRRPAACSTSSSIASDLWRSPEPRNRPDYYTVYKTTDDGLPTRDYGLLTTDY
jgi:hypothetical protein